MVETRAKQNIFWFWSDKVNWAKRGDVFYWLPQFLSVEKAVKSGINLQDLLIKNITYGHTPLGGKNTYTNEGVLFIRSGQLNDFFLDLTDSVYISENTHRKMQRSIIKGRDVLVATVGATIGAIAITPENIKEANCNQAVGILRSDEKRLNPYYLAIYLLSPCGKEQILRQSSGGARDNLDPFELKRVKIVLPSIKDQQKVEQIIKTAFQLKTEAEREYQVAVNLLETTLKFGSANKRTFTRWSNEIDFVERLDVGYWQLTIKIEGKKLSDVASVNTGKQYNAYENVKNGIDFISIKDFENLYVGEADRFVLKSDVIDKTKIAEGDVLLAVTGATIGKVGIFNRPEAVVSADVAIIRTKTLNPNFLGALIQSKYGKSLIDKYTYGATNKHLDIKGFSENFVIPKIDKKIMDKIGELLDNSIKHKEENKQKLQEAKEFVENLVKKA